MQSSRARFFNPYFAAAVLFGITALATCGSAQITGVTNFYQVDDHVFRGAQPTTAGFHSLAKLGVKTVIDLRETDTRSALEKKTVEAIGMRYINIPMFGMSAPSSADVEKVLAILRDPAAGPVFVHCRRGADRTGTVVACYRISHDGWNNAKALREAKADGMSWIEVAMQRYVMHYRAPAASAATAPVAVAPGN
jgi:protein-tyrosine phosphatase